MCNGTIVMNDASPREPIQKFRDAARAFTTALIAAFSLPMNCPKHWNVVALVTASSSLACQAWASVLQFSSGLSKEKES